MTYNRYSLHIRKLCIADERGKEVEDFSKFQQRVEKVKRDLEKANLTFVVVETYRTDVIIHVPFSKTSKFMDDQIIKVCSDNRPVFFTYEVYMGN